MAQTWPVGRMSREWFAASALAGTLACAKTQAMVLDMPALEAAIEDVLMIAVRAQSKIAQSDMSHTKKEETP